MDPVSYTHLDVYKRQEETPVMFTLPGSEVVAGKQVLVVESLQLDHAPAAPLDLSLIHI